MSIHQPQHGPDNDNPPESILGDADAFMQKLKDNMKNMTAEQVDQLLLDLERSAQAPDRSIEIYTDPKLDTFCCAQVPGKKTTNAGEIVDDPSKKTYLIGIPFIFAAGGASKDFLRGEIAHERGHAEWTDFSRCDRFRSLAERDGHDPKHLLQLDNLVEDPRMERLVGGPLRDNQRLQLFEKNRQLIIPNIAQGIAKGKMSPAEQLGFMMKLERLWALHAKELKGTEKPWSLDDLHPRALEEYKKIEPIIAKITGDASLPPMKVNAEVEKLIVDHLWPAMKRLLDEFPPSSQKKNQDEGDEGEEGSTGEPNADQPEEGTGQPKIPEGDPPLNPRDPSSWPDHLKQILQKMIEKHQKRLEKEAKGKKDQAEKNTDAKGKRDDADHLLKKNRDGFEDPKLREEYEEYRKQVIPGTNQMKRVFQRFVPKIIEPQYVYGTKGIRFSVMNLIRRKNTGKEKPLGKRKIPENVALILQVLIDVSGSMYQDRQRIENAVKSCIETCEGSKDHSVAIEILASDNKNIGDDEKYLIKGFDEAYDGRVKSRLMTMLHDFGGDNEDANAINVALPRIVKKKQQMRTEAERIGSLMVFITDSTTQASETRDAADAARQKTPMEGTAITPEPDIAGMVKFHFGQESVIPASVEEFPSAFQQILQRHMAHLKTRE
ncbi:VWA domain-containing protein [Candidatus Peribacteria bacterium]|nr:VWA domain-containing protein [Candidatus Peribacteria bacterium]